MKTIQLFIFLFCSSLTIVSQTIINLEKTNGIYIVPCKVNGLNMKFIFDTGASDVTISLTEAIFMFKNGYLSDKDLYGITYYQLANGDIQEGTSVILRNIKIGGHNLYNVKASIIHSLDAPLLLGQSALEKLGQFRFDYSKNTLTILDGRENNSVYGCISGNCLNGKGTYAYQNGDTYVGGFKDGKFNGYGTITLLSGEKYVGVFKNDNFNGYGSLSLPVGINYVGEFNNNKYVIGTLSFPDGSNYVGEFKNGEYNGHGTLTFPDGSKYVGEFKNWKFDGYGILISPNGNKYGGEYKDGKYIMK